ncbi:glycogen synthase [Salegentibacter salinarum]|uniref:Glycogen synthase n=1 Tax=Salegentibacter salinarum TaxID=447422 RepID=A0A2N0U0U6_9FLAO|nr:glycogen synthase [Salegentibacter salinarum]PKD20621.1 glycogen synthase [Salegentibacter salinarum]SKB83439.1 starch synthase [Salegentibacter salinarum]
MNVIHVSAECYPIAKVGGLGDVVGSLPKYQQESEVGAKVIMPFYDNKFSSTHKFKSVYESELVLGQDIHAYKILKLKKDVLDIEVLFVDIPKLLFKDFVYSEDDTARFTAFQIAAMDWLLTLKEKPSIIHCHDHHTGLIPFMAQECFKYESLNQIPVILTIHNAQYQGWFSHDKVHYLPAFDISNNGLLDWDGMINPLAAGIKCAWRVTTVSPSYMKELQQAANGLEGLLDHEKEKCVGILNGIDSEVWNPETDEFIIKNYSAKNIQSGKTANKKWLCKEFGFSASKPLFAFIGRLVYEKGAELLPEVLEEILPKKECSILILGSGNPEVESALENLKKKHKGVYNVFIGYDEKLSHLIYSGTDFLLMPSRVEPCGLNQLYSLRYGTIPVVRSIGGLKDTVIDIEDGGFGFSHSEASENDILQTITRAIEFYKDVPKFKKTRKYIMSIDHSWDVSAQQYIDLYNSLKSG